MDATNSKYRYVLVSRTCIFFHVSCNTCFYTNCINLLVYLGLLKVFCTSTSSEHAFELSDLQIPDVEEHVTREYY